MSKAGLAGLLAVPEPSSNRVILLAAPKIGVPSPHKTATLLSVANRHRSSIDCGSGHCDQRSRAPYLCILLLMYALISRPPGEEVQRSKSDSWATSPSCERALTPHDADRRDLVDARGAKQGSQTERL